MREDFFFVYVGCACPGDFDGNGLRSTNDLTTLLAEIGQSQSSTQCPPTLEADITGDNVVNTLDLIQFLGVFSVPCPFAPCPCPSTCVEVYPAGCSPPPGCEQQRPSRGEVEQGRTVSVVSSGQQGHFTEANMVTPPGPVLAALGFSSAEAFQSYVDTLTTEELKAYLVLVVAVAQNLDAGTP